MNVLVLIMDILKNHMTKKQLVDYGWLVKSAEFGLLDERVFKWWYL